MRRETSGRRPSSEGAATGVSQTSAVAVLVVFAVSMVVRLVYLLQIRDNPTFEFPTADPLLYHNRAFEILAGQFLGEGIFFHSSPIYPYFLAANYAVNGQSIFGTYVVQAAFDAAMVGLLWVLAERLFDRSVAWAAAILAAGYQAFLFFSGEMLEISLVLFASVLSVLLLVVSADRAGGRGRSRLGWLLAAGLALGMAAMGKPNVLATVPFLWMGWRWQSGLPWRDSVRPGVAFGLGVALVVLPLTLRNVVVGDDWVLTTSNGGINFFIGHNEAADGIFRVDVSMESDLEGASRQAAEAAEGRSLKPSEVSSYWFGRGLRFIVRHPGDELRLLGRKFLLTWNGYEIPNHFDLNFFTRYSPLLRWTPMRFATVIPFAIAGLALAWPHRRRLAVAYLFIGSYLATVLLFFVTARYRLPVVPFLCVFAGYALVELVRWSRRLAGGGGRRNPQHDAASRARPVVLAVGLALGIGLVNLPLYQPEDFYANQYASIGSVFKSQERFSEAAEYYRKAVESGPTGVLFRNNLGVCLLAQGKTEEGESWVRSALELDADYAPALRNLAKIAEERGDGARALELYGRAFAADPSFTEAGVDYGRVLAGAGRLEESEAALRAVLRVDSSDRSALWNLAVLLGTRMGRQEDALRVVERLLMLEPTHQRAHQLRAFLVSPPQLPSESPQQP